MVYQIIKSTSDGEKHSDEITTLLYDNGKLYSGGNDGKIKIWNNDLELEKEIDAHPVNVYSIAKNESTLFSSSNDGTVKCWNLSDYNCSKLLYENQNEEILRLFWSLDGKLYTGDCKGVVKIWEEGEVTRQYQFMEEITGLRAIGNLIFAAGYQDVSMIEINPGSKTLFAIKMIENGRGPICMIDHKICYISRDGKNIKVQDITATDLHDSASELKGHDMMINDICDLIDSNLICSGGYDGHVNIWDINTNTLVGFVNVNKSVNALAASNNEIYVATSDGNIQKIQIK